MTSAGFWAGRRVFLTGHTGFKGSWLALALADAGARVHGYALAAPTEPSLFEAARLAELLAGHSTGDVRDGDAVRRAMQAAEPEVVFHLAAQSLVRLSYRAPIDTYAVNVMGTANVLEAVRGTPSVRAVVSVTTDKCYENREWDWGYRENEALGGHDPYSSSKACAEHVTSAYARSFLAGAGVGVATARAGNVIGGGDWAADRLLPDFFRAADAGAAIRVRHPESTRPWQHVLEPLAGYVRLAERLVDRPAEHAEAWNFGPADDDARPVRRILEHLTAKVAGSSWVHVPGETLHEARALKLDSSKARNRLGWRPRWSVEQALDRTIEWHAEWRRGADVRAVTLAQCEAYRKAAGS